MSPHTDHEREAHSSLVNQAEPCGPEHAQQEDSEVMLPPGMHEMTLTPEAAEIMRQLLDDRSKRGAEGREMSTADSSGLLQKPQ
jgi:hypothetical protein